LSQGPSLIAALVDRACRYAVAVVLLAAVLGAAALVYTATHFSIDTDATKLLSPDLPWRQREQVYDAAFPQQSNVIAIVIDGRTAELAERAAAGLAEKLREDPKLFPYVNRPDGGPFFDRNGLLFLPVEEVRATMQQFIAAQPLLGTLAADPSLRGVMDALGLALQGVAHGETRLDDLARPLASLASTLKAVAAGQPAFLSWRTLVTGTAPMPRELRRFILVQPTLDYASLTPGATATDAIRNAAAALALDAAHGVHVRLTGPVVLADDEFATLADRAGLMTAAIVASMLLMLWLAVRSARIVAAIIATLLTGLAITAAFGLAAIGPYNLISVAFITLFVGLGVDFGIQFTVRFRAEHRVIADRRKALHATGLAIGAPLALAAASTAAGFYAFLPTDYRGVSQLGLIAGTGMIVAFVLSVTLLPALLTLFRPPPSQREIALPALAPVGRWTVAHRSLVLAVAAVLAVIALGLVSRLRFDFNPLHLQNPRVESVATATDLLRDPDTTPNTIDVLQPSLDDAAAKAEELANLPEVSHAVTLKSFVPEDQPPKLAAISDAAFFLEPTLNPLEAKPPPSDAEVIRALTDTATALTAAADREQTPAGNDARRLADALTKLAAATPSVRDRAADALVPGLKTMLDQARASLEAAPVTLDKLPPDLVRTWVAPDGTSRIEVFPKGDANDNETLRKFAAAVRAVAPDATGTPISIQESSRTIVRAFLEAGVLSFLAIVVLLILTLRNVRDVLWTMTPLLVTGLLTLGTSVAIGQPLNFANIIALPLIFGIGVAFNIYFVLAWRSGVRDMLASSTSRAIVFSALTTSATFGSLWLSSHPGTASMGKLLAISLLWTLVTAILFLPAALGAPRTGAPDERPRAIHPD
jgi:hypothetical protein